jgi:hypothetical protein
VGRGGGMGRKISLSRLCAGKRVFTLIRVERFSYWVVRVSGRDYGCGHVIPGIVKLS